MPAATSFNPTRVLLKPASTAHTSVENSSFNPTRVLLKRERAPLDASPLQLQSHKGSAETAPAEDEK